MTTSLEHVRYSCGIAGEEVAEMVDQLEAENARLREELAEEKRLLAEESQQYEDLREAYDRVCSELAAAQADAERYRWLRENLNNTEALEELYKYPGDTPTAEQFDAAIDDAIAKENGK